MKLRSTKGMKRKTVCRLLPRRTAWDLCACRICHESLDCVVDGEHQPPVQYGNSVICESCRKATIDYEGPLLDALHDLARDAIVAGMRAAQEEREEE